MSSKPPIDFPTTDIEDVDEHIFQNIREAIAEIEKEDGLSFVLVPYTEDTIDNIRGTLAKDIVNLFRIPKMLYKDTTHLNLQKITP